MVALAPPGLKGLRDRALLLLGFAGAFRRSELVALDVADIAETETGLLVTIRRSKTDQDGKGVTIAIARGDVACPPVRCGSGWMQPASRRARSSGLSTRPPRSRRKADRPIRCQHRQGVCTTRRLRMPTCSQATRSGLVS